MSYSHNPTAMSAVIGEEISLTAAKDRGRALLVQLIMPAVLLAFAGYLAVGMLTMRVPEGTAFPGPRFFPALIAGGLTLFAVLLAVAALREHQRAATQADAGDPAILTGEGADVEEGDAEEGSAEHARAVRIDWASLTWVIGSFLAFTIVLPYLGWIIAAALLFWGVARGFGARRPLAILIVGLTLSSIVYIAFDMALGMSLPSGVLGWEF
ncbi:tripartite tricarboxylate transporter TctB family protein [Leucobacter sp. NPDC015123]|uniref:tripartite tricarboxylate transporter TctB family protein n=1 Tax=Leucobacter sp. NPDC015123 TaxID=3364129 RepID=UPI0036F48D9D